MLTIVGGMNLLEETRKLLRSDKRTVRQISDQSGLPYSWLTKVHANDEIIQDPGVLKIQGLFEFLKHGKKYAVDEPVRSRRIVKRRSQQLR